VTVNEFKRWLKQNGCQFVKGGTNHEKVIRGVNKSVIPRHGSKQISTGTMNAIKKQLGL
jgi:mRNA interferase HicA